MRSSETDTQQCPFPYGKLEVVGVAGGSVFESSTWGARGPVALLLGVSVMGCHKPF